MILSAVTRRRLGIVGALAFVIGLGITSRVAPVGWPPYDKSLGDVLYGMAAYLAFGFLLPRVPTAYIASLAAAACLAVEFLQLTKINVELLKVPVLRWFLGSVFSWHDIACYLVGIAVIVSVDAFLSKRWFWK